MVTRQAKEANARFVQRYGEDRAPEGHVVGWAQGLRHALEQSGYARANEV